MDIIKGYTNEVKFAVPADLDDADFTVTYGTITTASTAATVVDGVATAPLPYPAMIYPGQITVELSFTYQSDDYTQSKTFNVVAPYLDIWELRSVLPSPQFSDSQAWEVETAVRKIIDAHCGQQFGVSSKVVPVLSNGFDVLVLPERLITLSDMTINGVSIYNTETDLGGGYFLGETQFNVVGDGWYIQTIPWTGSSYGSDITITVNGPIYDPFSALQPFKKYNYYYVNGTWGYEEVPEAVKQAALLLANDYACAESLYRDRYLKNMKAADWELEYSALAYMTTGNVRADQLLADYVRSGWAVI